ncbi:hypothetical protein [Saccharothrix sp. NRRL B-16348]|uniref:hypothetical protein n=1 Tax=Saccharothrix sp. NRRL B-16348 TaxID=1415542 RepID=UPI0018D15A91|nr:hypothetical protein [Saccharothrix sp. NRRL B-16348]
MFDHGLARAGYIEAPRDPDLALEVLRTAWRTIQHYGVEIDGRRHNGPALDPYRGSKSPYTGRARGRWPFQVDPDDVNRVYFRDPHARTWHTLTWEHAPALDMPFSQDALAFARRLAASRYTYPDDKVAVADLLERWNAGLGGSLPERRIALRLAREQTALDPPAAGSTVSALPSVARVLDAATRAPEPPPVMGDDDVDDVAVLEAEDDFYADALEDV